MAIFKNPIDIGSGRKIVGYFPTAYGRWETSDGIALVANSNGVIVAFQCHHNPRLETHRSSFQMGPQAHIKALKKAIDSSGTTPTEIEIHCADGIVSFE